MNTAAFGSILRSHRLAANLSQEALAEAARISIAAVSAYERGIRNAPHRETVSLLADALRLSGQGRAQFERAARRPPRRAPSYDLDPEKPADTLPVQTTSFIGREHELDDVSALLDRYRLVTLTGSGGIGKTRFAIQLALRSRSRYPNGIYFVDFGSCAHESLVLTKLSTTLGLPEPSTSGNIDMLVSRLKNRALLLLFDNCEHLIDAIGTLTSTLVRACSEITVIATSRERLRITGEAVYRLPTLSLPPSGPLSEIDARRYAAVDLFLDRVSTIEPHFTMTGPRVEAVVDICRRLDGIPLALELAASRLPALGLSALCERLNSHFSILSGGNRDIPRRQRALRATLEWSLGLLEPPERILFRRLGVFVSGWTLEAAQTVCTDVTLSADSIADHLASLVEKSLVTFNLESDAPRYRMLVVTRLFANDKAAEAGESAANARRHAEWLADAAQRADEFMLPSGNSHSWTAWHAKYDPEIDNIRAAVDWAFGPGGDALLGTLILIVFYRIWREGGLRREYAERASTAIATVSEDDHPRVVAHLLGALAGSSLGHARIAAGKRSVELFERVGDEIGLARALAELGWALGISGDREGAMDAAQRASAICLQKGLEQSLWFTNILSLRALIAVQDGNFEAARARNLEAIQIGERLGDLVTTLGHRVNLAETYFLDEDPVAALATANEALEIARQPRFRDSEMLLLSNRAGYRLALGDIVGSLDDARMSLAQSRDSGGHVALMSMQRLAMIAALSRDPPRAARLLGFLIEHNAQLGTVFEPAEQRGSEMLMTLLREQLSEPSLSQLLADGARLTMHGAVEEALAIED